MNTATRHRPATCLLATLLCVHLAGCVSSFDLQPVDTVPFRERAVTQVEDGIRVTAAVPEIPPPLIEQLENGGNLVAPVGRSGDQEEQTLVRVIKQGKTLKREEHGPCRFVPLRGRFGLMG